MTWGSDLGRRALLRVAGALLRPLAADEARARFWVRHVRVGVVLTEVSASVVVAYVAFADRPHRPAILATAAVVVVASPLLLLLPMQRMSTSRRGPLLFYAWSIAVTVVVAVIALLDGGAESPLVWLFVLTLTFAALAYPPLGVMLVGSFMVAAYLTVAALDSTVDPSADAGVDSGVLVVGAVLLTFAAMTAWISRNHWDTYRQQLVLTARLAEVDRAREEFVATTSHELRTPVASILGYVELLEDSHEPLGRQELGHLATVRRNAERLRDISENLLVLSRWDTERREPGRAAHDLTDTDLVEVARRVRDTMAPLASGQDTTLSLVVPDRPLTVPGSAEQLERALLNLVSNAVKYTPDGGDVTCVLGELGHDVVIEVRDTGIGIAEDDVERLFTRFFRAGSARERSISGVGLGLSIVREIVAAHGGSIDVTSALGRGTTFVVRLPGTRPTPDDRSAPDGTLEPAHA